MTDQGTQDTRKAAKQLIAEAQAARVQAHVRAMLSRLPLAVVARGEQQERVSNSNWRASLERELRPGVHHLNLGRFSRSPPDASERACSRPD
jgi:hypothetical protein